MRKHTLSLLFLLFALTCFAQKVKIDTVYFQGDVALSSKAEAFDAYQVCEVDRKGRKIGACNKFSKTHELLEISNFDQGIQTGRYFLYGEDGLLELEGNFNNGMKDGIWVNFTNGEPREIILFNIGNELSSRDLEVLDPIESKDAEGKPLIDKLASFPGAQQGWMNYLNQTLEYPRDAKRKGHEGDVFLKFVITKEGYVIAPKLMRSPAFSLGYEALRVVSVSPNWIPAESKGKAVDSFLQLRIAFALR